MKTFTVKQLLGYLGIESDLEIEVSKIVIDSRKVSIGDVFVAIKGERVDGNSYIDEALVNGAVYAIGDNYLGENSRVLRVENSVYALQEIAKGYLSDLKFTRVGVTGSNGKTSTKELIASIFSDKSDTIFYSKGNFNNEIGLPLESLKVGDLHKIGVFEMGMSSRGEINRLCEIVKPDIGVITNIGTSHIGLLGSQEEIFKAKMEITDYFNENSVLVIDGDDAYLRSINDTRYKILKCGFDISNDFVITDSRSTITGSTYSLIHEGKKQNININAPGEHLVKNSALAFAVGVELGLDEEVIVKGLSNYKNPSGRMNVYNANGLIIVDDTYNASYDSIISVASTLRSVSDRKLAVIGDILELGAMEQEIHSRLGEQLLKYDFHWIGFYGNVSVNTYDAYVRGGGKANHYLCKKDLSIELRSKVQKGDCILFKGSRGMKIEEIIGDLING